MRGRWRSWTTLRWTRAVQGHVSRVHRGEIVPGAGFDGDPICVDPENPGTASTLPDSTGSRELIR